MSAPVRVVGVDGWRKGWVGIVLVGGRFCRSFTAPSFADVIGETADAQVVAVDMPIGLLEHGVRQCDGEARRILARRSSTVFSMPPRAVLAEESYQDACRRARDLSGKAISRQAYALRERIFEVDAFAGEARLVEAHPEVSFRVLSAAPLAPKKTWAGQMERRRLLQRVGLRLPHDVGPACLVPPDDVLDAAVVAWTAHRVGRGVARPLPDPPTQRDPQTGRSIAIWA